MECSNSVTSDFSEMVWSIDAVAPDTATVGESVVLSAQTWGVTLPGSVFDVAIHLGLVGPGDIVTAEVSATVSATNTPESSRTTADIAIGFPVEVDVNGKARDVTATFPAPDMRFTAVGGEIALAVSGAAMGVDIGLPFMIHFSCSAVAGQGAFHTVIVTEVPVSATSSTTVPVSTTVLGPAATSTSTTTTTVPTTTEPTTTTAPTTTTTVPTTTTPVASTTTTIAQVQGTQQLAVTGAGIIVPIGAVGLALLNIGYLTASLAWPGFRRRSVFRSEQHGKPYE